MFSNNKKKAMQELLDTINQGIDLLTNKNLDKNLYEAFERYVISVVKLVDVAYSANYAFNFIQSNNNFLFNQINMQNGIGAYCNNPFSFNAPSQNPLAWNNPYMSNYGIGISTPPEIDYQDKLKEVLKKLVLIAKALAYE